jgi:CBS domain-containing protein
VDVVDVMTRNVLTVTPDTSVREAALTMMDNRISGLPVVEDDVVVGVISEADYVAKDSSRTWVSHVLFGHEDGMLSGIERVEELMSRHPITISATATVKEAARLMTRNDVNRLPVIDHGRLIGLVTRSDLIRAYVHHDEEIAGDVKHVLAVLPDPMSNIQVSVAGGVVVLTGEVETSAEARLVGRIAQGVEGVVSVDNRIGFDVTTEAAQDEWAAYPKEGATQYSRG